MWAFIMNPKLFTIRVDSIKKRELTHAFTYNISYMEYALLILHS